MYRFCTFFHFRDDTFRKSFFLTKHIIFNFLYSLLICIWCKIANFYAEVYVNTNKRKRRMIDEMINFECFNEIRKSRCTKKRLATILFVFIPCLSFSFIIRSMFSALSFTFPKKSLQHKLLESLTLKKLFIETYLQFFYVHLLQHFELSSQFLSIPIVILSRLLQDYLVTLQNILHLTILL